MTIIQILLAHKRSSIRTDSTDVLFPKLLSKHKETLIHLVKRKRGLQNTEFMIIWLLAGLCQAPKVLITTRITNKLTTNSAALIIRAGCVFGSI